MLRRVRVGVKYGDSSPTLAGQNYTYLVRPEQAKVGQVLTVPVNRGNGIYYTQAVVVDTSPKSGTIKRPRRAQ